MSELIERLQIDHVNMTRLVNLLAGQIELMRTGDADADYRLMQDILHYFVHYPDVVHHPREDVLFERLHPRAPELAGAIAQLRAEHDELAATGRELCRLLDGVAGGAVVSRARLLELSDAFVRRQREHMNLEERDLFPAARRLLGDADWRAIDAEIEHVEDPLFGPIVDQAYRQVYAAIEREL